jgi:hypothetical protein
MTVTGMIVLIGIVVAVLGLAFYGLAFSGNKRKDQAGSHNNWRQNTNTIGKSGWGESRKGYAEGVRQVLHGGGDGGDSGGSGDGGGSD